MTKCHAVPAKTIKLSYGSGPLPRPYVSRPQKENGFPRQCAHGLGMTELRSVRSAPVAPKRVRRFRMSLRGGRSPTWQSASPVLSSPCHCEPVTDVTGVAIRLPRPFVPLSLRTSDRVTGVAIRVPRPFVPPSLRTHQRRKFALAKSKIWRLTSVTVSLVWRRRIAEGVSPSPLCA